MKKLAIILSFLLILPVQTLAKSWPQSDTPADSCEGLARACTAAARELIAARKLIAGYENQIAAADARIEVARQQIEALKSIVGMGADRASRLEAVIAAEREAKAELIELKELHERRVAKLEGQLKRSRKVALIAGVAAVVAILIGARN